jgi:hypothetical protein
MGEQNMKLKYIVFSLVFLFTIRWTGMAGDRSNIRGMGMARTINAASRATDAIGINPANLAIPDVGRFTLSLTPLGAMARTELCTYGDYMNYFTGMPGPNGKRIARPMSNEEMNGLLSEMPDLPRTKAGFELMWFGISFQHPVVGGIGFAIIERVGTMNTTSKDFFRFAANGLDSLGSEYKFGETNLYSWWYREYNISYGRQLPFKPNFVNDLYAGISLKILRGYGVFMTDRQNSSFGNVPIGFEQYALNGNFDFLTRRAGIDLFAEDDSSRGSFKLFPEPVGKGIGIDFGFSSEVISGLRVALSVTDLGSMTWDRNVFESGGGGSFNVTGILGDMGDSVETALKGTTLPGAAFRTSLPATLRLGATMDTREFPFFKFIPGRLLLAFDYTQGLNKSLGNTTIPRFSLGVEYRVIRFIPIRTGLAVGGGDKVRWALGTGFNCSNFCFDIATEHFGMIFMPKGFQMISVSLGMKVRV